MFLAVKSNPSDNPETDPKIKGNPRTTLFVGRLNFKTTEDTLHQVFGAYGAISDLRLVRDISMLLIEISDSFTVTGQSRGYAFVTYEKEEDFKAAWHVSVIN